MKSPFPMTFSRWLRGSLFLGLLIVMGFKVGAAPPPNIVYILADDLGYGDIRYLNPAGKIATIQLDRLAAAGMVFTEAHSSSAVCTPTRYGILTGRYNWRSRLKSGVLGGMSPPLIEAGRLTVPEFLRRQGYHTAGIGKWHLGLDWKRKPAGAAFDDNIEKGEAAWQVDFTQPISHGPITLGFDYFFGIAASLDMVPYTFIENDRVTQLPTLDRAFPLMFGRTNRLTRRGPGAPDFEATAVLPTLVDKSVAYLEQRAAGAKAGHPFFLYLPLNGPHTPIAPTPEWQGKSGLNPYADFVLEIDAEVGRLLGALDRLGLAENTLVVFTSDNGCSPEAKFDELLARGHNPSADFRGTKADIFEGGHHIPFLVRWPGQVKPGTRCDQIICLNDLFATCADILGQKLPDNAAEDSVSILPLLHGDPTKPVREAVVHHSINGSFAIRQENWKLELCADSGGWSGPTPGSPAARKLAPVQLYDLSRDVAETNNLQAAHPEVVARLTRLLEKYVADGRSTPGASQTNATPVRLSPTRPNIIFVLTDDQGYGDLGWTGNPVIKTPHIDGFAAQSVRFTDFHVSPTCAPTRSALMTGRHEFKNGVTHTIFERERMTLHATTVAQTLQSAGYATGIFGKWHLGDEPAYQPDQRGFNEVFIHGGGGIGQTFPGSCGDAPGNTYFDPAILHNGRFEKTKGYCTDIFFAQALRWIDQKRQLGSPFFVYLTPNAPHAPLTCPEEYFKHYQGRVPDMSAKFFGMIENIDDNFGVLLQRLEEWGIADNTLVIFMTDNGGTGGVKVFNAGMRGEKGTAYQGGTRVPSFWRWGKNFGTPRDCAALSAHIDVFPTFAEIAGVPLTGAVAGQVEGRSLLPLLKNPKTDWPNRTLVTHLGRWERGQTAAAKFTTCSIRDQRFTLVNNRELFDLQNDFGETKNVLDQFPADVARLREAYDQWWGSVQPLLVNENVTGPKVNPFKARYWEQFGGGPDEALRRQMDPAAVAPAPKATVVPKANQ